MSDKINNDTIVNSFKQISEREQRSVFGRHFVDRYSPTVYDGLQVDVHKCYKLVDHHPIISKSGWDEYDQFEVCS